MVLIYQLLQMTRMNYVSRLDGRNVMIESCKREIQRSSILRQAIMKFKQFFVHTVIALYTSYTIIH